MILNNSLSVQFVVFCCFITLQTSAQYNLSGLGARSASVNHSSILFQDVWSVFNNPSGISNLENPQLGFHIENKYNVKDLNLLAIGLVLPFDIGAFGFSTARFGNAFLQDSRYGIAYGLEVLKNVRIATQINLLERSLAENLGNSTALSIEFGSQIKWSKNIEIGVHLFNINNAKKLNSDFVPVIMKMGLNYAISEKVKIVSQLSKSVEYKPEFGLGVLYMLSETVEINIGTGNNYSLASFGFGYRQKWFDLYIASTFHQILGSTIQMSINIKKQE